MTPLLDTWTAFVALHDPWVTLWMLALGLPLAASVGVRLAMWRSLHGRGAFVGPTFVRLLGLTALVVLGVGVPVFVLQVWFMPVILEAYPWTRGWLHGWNAVADGAGRVGVFVLLPLWMAWVVVLAVRAGRRQARGAQGPVPT